MVFIDGIVFSLQNSGGISVYFSEILKRLREPCYLSVYYNDNHTLKDVRPFFSDSVNIRINTVSQRLIRLIRYLDVIVPSDVTVFHSSYYRLPVFWQRSRLKVITTVHDFTYERMRTGVSARIHRWQKRRAILNSDEIVCISENTKQDLIHFFPEARSKSIQVIYNGVSDDFYRLPQQKLVNHDYVLYVGARTTYKNFKSLVSAMGTTPHIRLIIVGGGDISEDELILLNINLKGRFEHHLYVDNPKLNELYNNAFCLVYPSLYEGFGIPVVEAMKSGCPVIAASSSSIPEVAGDAAVLLDEVTPTAIANGLIELNKANFRSDLIARGYINAERFNWSFTFNSLYKLYLEQK